MGISPSFVLPVRAESTEYKVFGRRQALRRSGRELEEVSLGVGTVGLAGEDESLQGNVTRGSFLDTTRGGMTRGLERDTLEC